MHAQEHTLTRMHMHRLARTLEHRARAGTQTQPHARARASMHARVTVCTCMRAGTHAGTHAHAGTTHAQRLDIHEQRPRTRSQRPSTPAPTHLHMYAPTYTNTHKPTLRAAGCRTTCANPMCAQMHTYIHHIRTPPRAHTQAIIYVRMHALSHMHTAVHLHAHAYPCTPVDICARAGTPIRAHACEHPF